MITVTTSKDKIAIETGRGSVWGELILPESATGLVIFSHGSGSSRFSPRNNFVASILNRAGFGTFLLDLLTEEEDRDVEARFDIGLLALRLSLATEKLCTYPSLHGLPLGYFGASTGAASALKASVETGNCIKAIVSRGGRPDLVPECIPQVKVPTLLIVGEEDNEVLTLNREVYRRLHCTKQLYIVPGATHLFEEPGALETVGNKACEWFSEYLIP